MVPLPSITNHNINVTIQIKVTQIDRIGCICFIAKSLEFHKCSFGITIIDRISFPNVCGHNIQMTISIHITDCEIPSFILICTICYIVNKLGTKIYIIGLGIAVGQNQILIAIPIHVCRSNRDCRFLSQPKRL